MYGIQTAAINKSEFRDVLIFSISSSNTSFATALVALCNFSFWMKAFTLLIDRVAGIFFAETRASSSSSYLGYSMLEIRLEGEGEGSLFAEN